MLQSEEPSDRYAAAKALGYLPSADTCGWLECALRVEPETRAALEIAGALARLGAEVGFEYLAAATTKDDFPASLRMEAVLILSELLDKRAVAVLEALAGTRDLENDEIRQAAVWGLGASGAKRYDLLCNHIADDYDVALHAIAAFGEDVPRAVIDDLVRRLVDAKDQRAPAAAAEVLRLIGSREVAEALLAMWKVNPSPWVVATLGRLPKCAVSDVDLPADLVHAITPVRLVSDSENWLAAGAITTDLRFLLQQRL